MVNDKMKRIIAYASFVVVAMCGAASTVGIRRRSQECLEA